MFTMPTTPKNLLTAIRVVPAQDNNQTLCAESGTFIYNLPVKCKPVRPNPYTQSIRPCQLIVHGSKIIVYFTLQLLSKYTGTPHNLFSDHPRLQTILRAPALRQAQCMWWLNCYPWTSSVTKQGRMPNNQQRGYPMNPVVTSGMNRWSMIAGGK